MIVRASVVFPQPDSPTSASTSPRAHVEIDAVDGARDRAAARREADMELARLEERLVAHARAAVEDVDARGAAVVAGGPELDVGVRTLRLRTAQRGWNGQPEGRSRADRVGRRPARTGACR